MKKTLASIDLNQFSHMKVIAAIPARYAASRFPGKLLADLNGKPVIQHTYENVLDSGLFDRVIVVTENSKIESFMILKFISLPYFLFFYKNP